MSQEIIQERITTEGIFSAGIEELKNDSPRLAEIARIISPSSREMDAYVELTRLAFGAYEIEVPEDAFGSDENWKFGTATVGLFNGDNLMAGVMVDGNVVQRNGQDEFPFCIRNLASRKAAGRKAAEGSSYKDWKEGSGCLVLMIASLALESGYKQQLGESPTNQAYAYLEPQIDPSTGAPIEALVEMYEGLGFNYRDGNPPTMVYGFR